MKRNDIRTSRLANEMGFTLFEYIIALIIVMVAFVAWIGLSTTAVKNGQFVSKLADVKALATSKAAELAGNESLIAQNFPMGITSMGSLEPDNINPGCCYEELNRSGCIIKIDASGNRSLNCGNIGNPPAHLPPGSTNSTNQSNPELFTKF